MLNVPPAVGLVLWILGLCMHVCKHQFQHTGQNTDCQLSIFQALKGTTSVWFCVKEPGSVHAWTRASYSSKAHETVTPYNCMNPVICHTDRGYACGVWCVPWQITCLYLTTFEGERSPLQEAGLSRRSQELQSIHTVLWSVRCACWPALSPHFWKQVPQMASHRVGTESASSALVTLSASIKSISAGNHLSRYANKLSRSLQNGGGPSGAEI